jgi:hypothetical protein
LRTHVTSGKGSEKENTLIIEKKFIEKGGPDGAMVVAMFGVKEIKIFGHFFHLKICKTRVVVMAAMAEVAGALPPIAVDIL